MTPSRRFPERSDAEQILASQPFSKLLGAWLDSFYPGRAEIRIPLRPELTNQHGFVHGGVIAYAADNAIAFAAGSVLGKRVANADTTIHYLRPAPSEGVLVARATIPPGHSRRRAVCRCEIMVVCEEGETLCAVAQGTVRITRFTGEGNQ